MLERLSKTHRNIALVAIFLVIGWFAWSVRSVLNPLILGYLLAYILRPLVQRLEDRGVRRRTAVNVIFALFGVSAVLLVGGVYVQARDFVSSQVRLAQSGDDPFLRAERAIDSLLGDAGDWIDSMFGGEDEAAPGGAGESESAGDGEGRSDGPEGVPEGGPDGGSEGGADQGAGQGADGDPEGPPGAAGGGAEGDEAASGAPADDREAHELTLRSLAKAWFARFADGGDGSIDRAEVVIGYLQRIFGGLLSVLAFLVLLPVYTYFLLFELERIHDFVRMHVPKRERDRVTRIGQKVGAVIANFFRGRLLICLLKGLVLALGLTLLQLPYGFLLGIVAGFLALIPFVGPTIGYLLGLLFAFQQRLDPGSSLWAHLALISALFAAAEFLEGYVFIPKVLGDSLGLHPVAILVSVFVGGSALGLFGFLIAIPLAATVIILFKELVMPAVEDFAEEDSHTRDDVGPRGGGAEAPEGGAG